MTIFANSSQLLGLANELDVDTELYETVITATMDTLAVQCWRALQAKYPGTEFETPDTEYGVGGILSGFRGYGEAPEELQACDPDGELS